MGAGPNGAIQCGDLLYVHTFPGYRSMGNLRAPSLIYNGATALHRPVVVVDYTTFAGDSLPDTLKVEIKRVWDGTVIQTHYYHANNWPSNATQVHRMTIPMVLVGAGVNRLDVVLTPSRLGVPWTPFTQRTRLITESRPGSPFGAGWWLAGLERLRVLPGDSLILVRADASVLMFLKTGATTYSAPPGEYSTISKVGTTYKRSMPGGRVSVWYRASGHVDSIVELNPTPNVARYLWSTSPDTLLTGVVSPPGRDTLTFAYFTDSVRITIPTVGTATIYKKQDSNGPSFNADSIRDPDGHMTRFTYSAWYRMTSSKARGTGTAFYTYDAAYRVDSAYVAGSGAPATQYRSWQLLGSPGTAGTQANPAATALRDSAQILVSRWRGSIAEYVDTARFTVDRFEFPTAYSLPGVGGGTVGRDSKGQPVEISAPGGGYYLQQWDGDGNLTQVSRLTTGGWSSQGSVWAVTNYGYHPTWKTLTAVAPPAGGGMGFSYDEWGRRATAVDGSGNSTAFTYNSRGQLRTITEPGEAIPTTLAYDTVGAGAAWNLQSVSDSSGTTIYQYYANKSDVLSVTDPAGGSTTYTYDTMKRVLSVLQNNTSGPSRMVQHGYDDVNRIRTMIDPRGVQSSWKHDLVGRVIERCVPAGVCEDIWYVDGTNPTWITQRNGTQIFQDFDAAGRLVRRQLGNPPWGQPPDDEILFGYDANGNATNIFNRHSTITRSYDAYGALTYERQDMRGWGSDSASWHWVDIYHAYDLNGRRSKSWVDRTITGLAEPCEPSPELDPPPCLGHLTATDSIVYSYDGAGNLAGIGNTLWQVTQGQGNHSWSYGYDVKNRLIERGIPTFSGSRSVTLTYDTEDRLRTYTVSGGGPVAALNYDGAGRPLYGSIGGASFQYTYDQLGQVLLDQHIQTDGFT